jgi:hypothetical protein
MTAVQQGARAATRPVSTLLAVPRRIGGHDGPQRQESALAGDTAPASTHAGANGGGAAAVAALPGTAPAAGAMATPVSSNGNSPSAAVRDAATPGGASANGHARVSPVSRDGEASPRVAHEALMQRAREWRRRRREEAERRESES